jgi:hypothetical protein
MITRLHVNRHVLAANRRHGRNDPAVSLQQRGRSTRCRRVRIEGPSEVIHADKPLSCGARVYVQTTAPVTILE